MFGLRHIKSLKKCNRMFTSSLKETLKKKKFQKNKNN